MIDGICTPMPNGYMGQIDCLEHGTGWPCPVTEESWAAYLAAMDDWLGTE